MKIFRTYTYTNLVKKPSNFLLSPSSRENSIKIHDTKQFPSQFPEIAKLCPPKKKKKKYILQRCSKNFSAYEFPSGALYIDRQPLVPLFRSGGNAEGPFAKTKTCAAAQTHCTTAATKKYEAAAAAVNLRLADSSINTLLKFKFPPWHQCILALERADIYIYIYMRRSRSFRTEKERDRDVFTVNISTAWFQQRSLASLCPPGNSALLFQSVERVYTYMYIYVYLYWKSSGVCKSTVQLLLEEPRRRGGAVSLLFAVGCTVSLRGKRMEVTRIHREL